MFSLIGMTLGVGVLFLIGLGSASKTLHELEDRDLNEYQNVQIELETTTAYASLEPIIQYRRLSRLLIGLILLLVGSLVIEGGWDEFTLNVLLVLSAILGPFIAFFVIKSLSTKKAVQQNIPILEIDKNGITCHSNLCGPVQEIAWSDIESYGPVLPTFGTVSCLVIVHKLPNIDFIKRSKYAGHTTDIPLASLITLLEHYSNIPAHDPR